MLLPCLVVFVVLNHYTPIIYSVPFYQPVEDYVILCGSSSNPYVSSNQNGNRSYTGDSNSNNSDLFSLLDYSSSSVISKPSYLPSSVSLSKFYDSARLSHSEFTYSFTSLTHGPKFLRLHFLPASYSNFQSYNALFSVKSNSFTLLKDFNASLVAGEGGTVSREYCIHIEPGESLNVTLTPSNNTTTSANAYAFINAIEIVSMPDYLYFTNSSKESLRLLGQLNDDDFPIRFTTAMQLKYRINVGGGSTGADEDDTGMSRPWLDDNDFLKQVTPRSLPHDVATPLNYSKIPNYTALSEIYRNGRSYGQGQNTLHNVTWEFEVVSGFYYLVRLHFCEVDPAVNETEDRVFRIFVAESLAEEHADVFYWTGGRMVPYYTEYAVSLLQGRSDDPRVNLSIKLQPHPDINVRRYDDVILNGIEIFKLSDFSNSTLAEPNYPENPREPDSSPNNNNHHSSINEPSKPYMLGVVIGSVTGFIVVVLVIIIGFIVFRQRRVKQNKKGDHDHDHSKYSTSLPSDLCRCFSIAEIKEATNNFDDVFQVGVGGFGHVYKGYIDNRTIPVAIKRLKPGSQQGAHEFLTEIEMLSQLRHLHLVSLIGYCNDDNEMILVYEFMARGTLRDHLYGSDDNQSLSWKQRLEICLGAARGLSYLHTGAKHNIIHRDVKSTNILIDEKWVAKVSDFGLSKVGPTGMSRSHVSTVVKGSVGYLDPEYYKRQRLTQKSDVYSFGVVLLEVLCGRPSLDRTVEKQKASLVGWVRKCYEEGMIHETIDPLVIESITPECLKAFSAMALKCLVDDGNERPSMNDVVWGLEFALELQETKVEDNKEITLSSSRKDVIIEQKSDEMGFSSSETTTGRGSDESSSSKMTMSSNEEQALVAAIDGIV